MKLKKYLDEAFQVKSLTRDVPANYISKIKLTRPGANKVSKQVAKVVKGTYFIEIPLKGIFDALRKSGLVALQEDQTEWSGFLLGGVKKTEQIHFLLGWADSKDTKGRYQVVPDAALNLSYFKMPSGKYEVLAYVS